MKIHYVCVYVSSLKILVFRTTEQQKTHELVIYSFKVSIATLNRGVACLPATYTLDNDEV